LNSNGLIMWE